MKTLVWSYYQPHDIWAGSCEAYGKSYSKDLIVILNLVAGNRIFIKFDTKIKKNKKNGARIKLLKAAFEHKMKSFWKLSSKVSNVGTCHPF